METKTNTRARVISLVVIALFAAAAVLSAMFMNTVAINYNLADYLGADTQTKIALDIIDEEFGMTGSIQVMVRDVTPDRAEELADEIEALPNVLNVNFDKYDTAYYKQNNALFAVIVDGDDYSDNAKQLLADIKTTLADENAEYGGTTVEKQSLQDAITSEMTYILAISLCLVVAILLITSESWLEPLVLLAASGVAVLINRGTNVIFGEISYITNSICAILQLALSIDYSIVLLHAYRDKKQTAPHNGAAMLAAIRSVVKPVSASALTTIAGLLALLFMSFRIGFDIGIVLMKGIVVSAITALTLLPAMVLLLDKPMRATRKKSFAPRGKFFCRLACRRSWVIAPLALVLVVVCGVLQSGNSFLFTDTKAGNEAITQVFGNHNTVVAVYPNSDDRFDRELELNQRLADYRTADGKSVLSGCTAYSTTVREVYDVEKCVRKLNLSQQDAQLLLTMYNLYRDPEQLKLTFEQFVSFADELLQNDADALEFADADTSKTVGMMNTVVRLMSDELTADELYERLTTGAMEGTDVQLSSIRQLYGMYFYQDVPEQSVDFQAMLSFLIAYSQTEDTLMPLDAPTLAQLTALRDGIAQFAAQMEQPLDQQTFRLLLAQNYGINLPETQAAQIFALYFAASGEEAGETVPFLPLMKFLNAQGLITDPTAAATLEGYGALYDMVHRSCGYQQFLPVLAQIAQGLSGQAPELSVTEESAQQLYILYFYQTGTMPEGKLTGRAFCEYAQEMDASNAVVHAQLTEDNRRKLSDMRTIDTYASDASLMTYGGIYGTLEQLQGEITSSLSTTLPDQDKISGVFIKAAQREELLTDPVMACDLLDFVSANMDTNSLLLQRMSQENRNKVSDAQADIDKANDLFLGEHNSRMLLSIDLPNESEDTREFVQYLSDEVRQVFGDGAYIAGDIVSTFDLENSFSHDNTFITVFTLISIFVIVLVIFRSLSIPMILVAVIQGAIFIAMSTQLMGDGIFFMSYIVATCILMGATIDYGILMSSNYVADRADFDRKKSLELSVEAAMPTVFSSGMILTVYGFVIHFISSQNSISTVGLLLGIGAVCSVVMITVVLPSLLYLLDAFVLKLSIKKKK